MAYQFDLETDFDEIFIDKDGTQILDFALGYDLDEETVVLMSVMLVSGESYLTGELGGVYDLQFGIRERNLSEEQVVTAPDFSTTSVEKYIPKEHRRSVFDMLLRAIDKLVSGLNPSYITMETYYGHLPMKALRKYDQIGDEIVSCGYERIDNFRDEASGIDYWFFGRKA